MGIYYILEIKMSVEQFRFLEQRLSPVRAEYLNQVAGNVPELLRTFDELVLGGYSERREMQVILKKGYSAVVRDPLVFIGEEDRPVYERLSAQAKILQGEEREAFLYGLRRALLYAEALIRKEESAMARVTKDVDAVIDAKDLLPRPLMELTALATHEQLERLRGVSSGYRDVYRVMVDAVRQQVGK